MDLTYLNATNNLPEKERKIKIENNRKKEKETPEQMTQTELNQLSELLDKLYNSLDMDNMATLKTILKLKKLLTN